MDQQSKGLPENVIFVGKKPFVTYALAVIKCFGKGAKEVEIRGREGNIRAAAVALNRLRSMYPKAKTKSVEIVSEEAQFPDPKTPEKKITKRLTAIIITVTNE